MNLININDKPKAQTFDIHQPSFTPLSNLYKLIVGAFSQISTENVPIDKKLDNVLTPLNNNSDMGNDNVNQILIKTLDSLKKGLNTQKINDFTSAEMHLTIRDQVFQFFLKNDDSKRTYTVSDLSELEGVAKNMIEKICNNINQPENNSNISITWDFKLTNQAGLHTLVKIQIKR